MTRTKSIPTGTYTVAAPCPECGTVVDVLVRLSSVLTVPQDDPPQLRVRCKGESVGHSCRGGRQVDVFEAIAEATGADEADVFEAIAEATGADEADGGPEFSHG